MVAMRLAEAEWHVVRQEVLPRFEAGYNCRVWAIDVSPETLVQRLWAMHQAGCMEIDLLHRTICVFRNRSVRPWQSRLL
jgi:trehalose transport system substrate-binding protein